MKIVIELPSKNEALITVITMALFLLLTGVFIGLRSEHFLMVALYLVLFFAGLPTRKLALALLPFAIFGISYDWMRICPNYEVNPIDVAGLYNLEKSLFGVMDNGILITPCEYFAAHNWPQMSLPASFICVGFPCLSCSVFACISRSREKHISALRWYFCWST